MKASTPYDFLSLSKDDLLKLGATLGETLSDFDLVSWANLVLAVATDQLPPVPELETLIRAGKDRQLWPSCKEIFHSIRALTLRAEKVKASNSAYLSLLSLGENVAKVVYNASKPSTYFDRDAVNWIPVCAQSVCRVVADETARVRISDAVLRRSGAQASSTSAPDDHGG
jgi:hypothetical protein